MAAKLSLCLLLLSLFVAPAQADIRTCIDATCRIRSPDGSTGTGCAFEIRDGEVRILTNYHVAENRPQLSVEFWKKGHKSIALSGASRFYSYVPVERGVFRDINVIAVPVAAFGKAGPPPCIPLAKRGTILPDGLPIASVGCEEGRWPSAWVGHVVRHEDHAAFKFLPMSIPGRSGSAVFDEAGTQIVGLVAWNDTVEFGIAMHSEELYRAFDGTASTRMVQFCGPGGCQPRGGGLFLGGGLYGPGPQQPAGPLVPVNPPGSIYPTLPGDDPAAGVGPLPYASTEDLKDLEDRLTEKGKQLYAELDGRTGAIDERLKQLELATDQIAPIKQFSEQLGDELKATQDELATARAEVEKVPVLIQAEVGAETKGIIEKLGGLASKAELADKIKDAVAEGEKSGVAAAKDVAIGVLKSSNNLGLWSMIATAAGLGGPVGAGVAFAGWRISKRLGQRVVRRASRPAEEAPRPKKKTRAQTTPF